jgi:hypothetical protein
MNFFPHLLSDLGVTQYKRSAHNAAKIVTFVKIGAGKAVIFLRTSMILHLGVYRGTV